MLQPTSLDRQIVSRSVDGISTASTDLPAPTLKSSLVVPSTLLWTFKISGSEKSNISGSSWRNSLEKFVILLKSVSPSACSQRYTCWARKPSFPWPLMASVSSARVRLKNFGRACSCMGCGLPQMERSAKGYGGYVAEKKYVGPPSCKQILAF